jgi:hypothetical protein
LFNVMTIAFIFILPASMGALTIFLSDLKKIQSFSYRVFIPWLPIFGLLILTLLFSIEGWACWIMALPIFLLASSIGGLIAGYFKLRQDKKEKMFLSIIMLLPFFVAPIEQAVDTIPGQFKASTYIDIHADHGKIWNNVTRVREIAKAEDRGWLTRKLGFPRPIKAELDHEGVGGFRKAIFDKGLVFDETVISYVDQKEMTFSIKANTHDIPSTTMDRHIVVGGDYFDVLTGTYELETLDSTTYRLHLTSSFKLHTTFNFYASWWAGWIMKDIQENILQVIKERSEHE